MESSKRKRNRILLDFGTNEVEFLRFFLNDAFYGINVSKIRQAIVFEHEKLSFVPESTAGFKGNYLYRGDCIPVICLKGYFGIPATEQRTGRELLLICDFNQCTLGFVVDGIRDILRCSWDRFEPARFTEKGHAAITGNLVYDDEITPVLDVETILGRVFPDYGIERDLSSMDKKPHTKFTTKRIMYCEDSPTVQKVLVRYLQNLGFSEITTFSTGAEGLSFIRGASKQIDLIISDIEMPKLDGLTLCKEIKSDPKSSNIPVVFFSSTVTDEMKDKCRAVGGEAAFSKPEINQLAEYIEAYLSR